MEEEIKRSESLPLSLSDSGSNEAGRLAKGRDPMGRGLDGETGKEAAAGSDVRHRAPGSRDAIGRFANERSDGERIRGIILGKIPVQSRYQGFHARIQQGES